MTAYQSPDDVTVMLPVTWYGTADRPRVPVRHRVLGFTLLVLAAGASLAAPVAGPLAVTAGITALRVAGRVTESFAARRAVHRRRGWNLLVLLASLPWVLVWATVEAVLVALLVLVASAMAVAGVVAVAYAGRPALAGAAIAVGYTVLTCLGPWSRVARRQLNRSFEPIRHGPLTVGVVSLLLGAVALGLTSLVVSGSPALWPAHGLHGAVIRLLDTGSGPCQPPPPALRLTMLCARG